jgi:hypothetical protein
MFNPDSLRKHLSTLSDDTLLETNPEDLTEEARAIYDAELASRNLSWSAEGPAPESTPLSDGAFPKPEDGELVLIGRYENFAEARYAYQLLRHEQIPVWLAGADASGRIVDPTAPLDLVTFPEHLETAQMLLSPEISDEELARLAEEAGAEDDQA